ncbi:hypothetical protein TNCV_4092181 [Trichonephila clavipes]|nr:hypothetical protein TNCV_4092181 [Trichonephila clavipes]
MNCHPSGLVVSETDCSELGIPKSRPAASSLVRLVEREERLKVSDIPWCSSSKLSNLTVTCMVLKTTNNDRASFSTWKAIPSILSSSSVSASISFPPRTTKWRTTFSAYWPSMVSLYPSSFSVTLESSGRYLEGQGITMVGIISFLA